MGITAENVANQWGIDREMQDAFAVASQNKAEAAQLAGRFVDEIVPVILKSRRGETTVEADEYIRHGATLENMQKLRPAFAKDGSITAANSSSISDGASALVLTSATEAQARGLTPMARILAHARHSQAPNEFTIAPIGAIKKLFEKTGWTVDDVDLFEINEAFAMVTMLAMQDLGLDHAKVNIHGGACAQGHPIGSTGSRIIVSLMYALKQLGKKRGVAALCIGGGEATAVGIELI